MELTKRKHPRLKKYDYSTNGCYFATVCINERRNLLGEIEVRRDALIPPSVKLSSIGECTDKYIKNISLVYDNILIDKYVIMPNHIHLLITIHGEYSEIKASHPTLHTIIRSLKTLVTKEVGLSIWQDSYYDHIIRSKEDYLKIMKYIDDNPLKWKFDELYNI